MKNVAILGMALLIGLGASLPATAQNSKSTSDTSSRSLKERHPNPQLSSTEPPRAGQSGAGGGASGATWGRSVGKPGSAPE